MKPNGDSYKSLLPEVKGSYRFNSQLRNWFNTDSYAEIIFRPQDIDDLQYFLKNFSKKEDIKIIGAASNIIFKNKVTKGVIIKLTAKFSLIKHKQNIIEIGTATLCKNAAQYSQNNSLTNLEFMTGIPGSIGGAIAMNAGCYGSEISDFLISATALDLNGNIINLTNNDFGFHYRGSHLIKKQGHNLIFTSAKFQCQPQSSQIIANKIAEFEKNRQESQPIRAKTGGSTFKNPKNHKAWELIDKSGCRGLKFNDAQISNKHCNFLINTNNASGKDLITLINQVQDKVKKQQNINLETEIKII